MSLQPLDAPPLTLTSLTRSDTHATVRLVGGRSVIWVEFDKNADTVRLTSETSAQITAGARAALDMRIPLVLVLSMTGADITEGVSALHAWGQSAAALVECSGVVPTAIIVDGPAVSGPALLLGLADLAVMTENSYAFVNGPVMVEQFTGVGIDVGFRPTTNQHLNC